MNKKNVKQVLEEVGEKLTKINDGWRAYKFRKENEKLRQENKELRAELERYKRGDLSRDEIHNMCHNIKETVPREEFEQGCLQYQNKIYGEKLTKHERVMKGVKVDPEDNPDLKKLIEDLSKYGE